MQVIAGFFQFIGRCCISAVFIVAGIGKIFGWDQTLVYMRAHNMVNYTELFLLGAILVELVGGFSLAVGFRPKFAATILALFLIPVTSTFHNFWDLAEPERAMQMVNFLKNLAIFGGLVCYISSPSRKEELAKPEIK